MPTPRPIIVASVGAIVGTVTTWPRSPISESPASSPSTAETIGSPIATSVPKVKARMIIAAIRPITSLLSVSGSESSVPTEPPTATSMPACRAGFAGVEDALGDVLGELAAADVEQDRDEGGLLVLADLRLRPAG